MSVKDKRNDMESMIRSMIDSEVEQKLRTISGSSRRIQTMDKLNEIRCHICVDL